jgi:hypothetical protein
VTGEKLLSEEHSHFQLPAVNVFTTEEEDVISLFF